ncbi:MAG: hypothetical protein U0350_10215 [Caldilineaceae bacterium]
MALSPRTVWAHDVSPAHAQVYTGLVADQTFCGNGGYRLDGTTFCTHGPDTLPTVEQIHAAQAWMAATTSASILCIGDGVSGQRVQVVYVRAEDQPDEYAKVVEQVRAMTAAVDAVYEASAQETNGHRRIRFVTTPDCQLDVLNVALPAKTLDTWSAMVDALRLRSYADPKRKYLLFVDADVYCGISTIRGDTQPGLNNVNNQQSGYARVDRGCWNAMTAAHELTHTLGGVQNSAPHSTGAWHCTDENDLMCYSDANGTAVMTVLCTEPQHAYLLDCDHDDYFHTNPPPDNYLYDHWNVANSGFLLNPPADHPAVASLSLTTAITTIVPTTAVTLTLVAPNSPSTLGYIQSVQFFQDGVLLGEISQAPYQWLWPGSATLGDYPLTATIHTWDDMQITLQPLVITVKQTEEQDHRLYLPVVQK